MPKVLPNSALRQIHRLFGQGTATGLSDAQLLERFASDRDEAAFEMMIARHGPMVLGVCLRVLHSPHDAEDAFQATFLVLARKAGSLWVKGSLASWLYQIAVRIAVQAKTDAARLRRHEQQAAAAQKSERGTPAPLEPDVVPMLCQEIDRLPEKYRAPVVLCHLEEFTHEAAAEVLRCPVGTVHGRLARARAILRRRLTKRGMALSAGMIAATLAGSGSHALAGAVPSSLRDATLRAAINLAAGHGIAAAGRSATVDALLAAALRTMTLRAFKSAAVVAVTFIGTVGASVLVGKSLAGMLAATDETARRAAVGKRLPRNDSEAIQGKWIVVEIGQVDHQPTEEERAHWKTGQFTATITTDWLTFDVDKSSMGYRLDPSTRPKRMTLTATDGPRRGNVVAVAIYSLEEDDLKICIGRGQPNLPPQPPHGFDIKSEPRGTFPTLFVMKRKTELAPSDPAQRPNSRSTNAPQNADTSLPGKSDAKQSSRTEDQTQRVRELIYFFRTYRVFCRDEEWAQTIRELATIGKAAVPELVAELDRTDRDATSRSLAFCLRAIGDPRAVPALIRAIAKIPHLGGGDCGLLIVDPDLRRFMQAHQDYEEKSETLTVVCGRPLNEIFTALERITKHREPPDLKGDDPLAFVSLRVGTPEQQAQKRALFEERQKRWEAWWSEHWREFITQEELQSVELPTQLADLVEMAGVARYGVLFPTGPQVRLGPVRVLRLTSSVYRNGRSHLDFDTGRMFMQDEGIKTADWREPVDFGSRYISWYRQNGIDVRCLGLVDGKDLLLWLIDDSRWDTLEAEIQKDEPLHLGREATRSMLRFEKTSADFKYDELATFLFTTREGGRGIVQVFPQDLDSDRCRLRYRMWLSSEAKPVAVPQVAQPPAPPRGAKSPGTPFGKIVTTTLDLPAEGREFLLDLKTGRKAAPPEILKPADIANASILPGNEQFTRWCRDQGVDVFGYVAAAAPGEASLPEGAETARARRPQQAQSQFALIGLDVTAARILPQTFDELSVEEAREILDRMPADTSRTAWMTSDAQLAELPDTFAFKTREGAVGLLQVEATEQEAGKLIIRYRLERSE